MAYKYSMELHHHFPKLAEESGFAFNINRPRIRTDWDKFKLIDIENLIRERRFIIIEQHINDILNCVLESEFDVRILDAGVLKLFKLAQLTVEYQQFCRHYLDRSVCVMREELNSLLQELDTTKKDLKDKEDELKRLKKRSKYTYRPPIPYGNDNIATMILKTLSNKGDIFPSTSNETLHYNKCSYCDKVFLNQLYLRSHMSRRHTNVTEIAQKDTEDTKTMANDTEKSQLHEELADLKTKLKDMECLILTLQSKKWQDKTSTENVPEETKSDHKESFERILTKDAEVTTNIDDYFMDKIEEWKKQEHEKYNSEISQLKTQIIETINSLKEKDIQNSTQNDHKIIEALNNTIRQQSAEIFNLQQELKNSKIRSDAEENERKQEMQAQMEIWSNRTAVQSKQYETLLQKLNDVAQEARESRAIAEAEKERAEQLRALLQEKNKNKKSKHDDLEKTMDKVITTRASTKTIENKDSSNIRVTVNQNLENLHRKAQELLNRSNTSSDSSTESEKKCFKSKESRNVTVNHKMGFHNGKLSEQTAHNRKTIKNKTQKSKSNDEITSSVMSEHSNTKKSKSNTDMLVLTESPNRGSGSPVKIVRAKITEEVNSRLVSAGVDPLKSRIPRSVFHKQRMHLQQQHDSKSKKNPSYPKVKNSILAYLDSNTVDINNGYIDKHYQMPTNKIIKPFSLTTVLSNVKSKALSLVKTNETNINGKAKRIVNGEVSKRALSFLKTPPDSASSSPATREGHVKANHIPSRRTSNDKLIKVKKIPRVSEIHSNTKDMSIRKNIVLTNNTDTDDDDFSSESDHKYYNSAVSSQSKNSVDHLIKSPARRPSSTTPSLNLDNFSKVTNEKQVNIVRTASNVDVKLDNNAKQASSDKKDNTSDDMESSDSPLKRTASVDNLHNVQKQTKGVLKNASSTSSLNKKKVLFDMEAIQMKSVSASPSQSITDKSDANEKLELGLVNLDTEDWDISSIENEPLKTDTRIQNNIRSPKIAELKQTIESQLARRNETPSTVLIGGVDLLAGSIRKTSSVAGSNTSLGSSILDESESILAVNKRAFVKPKNIVHTKDDSDLDLSQYSVDDIINKNKSNESF